MKRSANRWTCLGRGTSPPSTRYLGWGSALASHIVREKALIIVLSITGNRRESVVGQLMPRLTLTAYVGTLGLAPASVWQ